MSEWTMDNREDDPPRCGACETEAPELRQCPWCAGLYCAECIEEHQAACREETD